MAHLYMDSTGLLATLIRDHPGHYAAGEFWRFMLRSRASLAVSVTTLDHVMPLLEQDILDRRAPYRVAEAFFGSRIDRIEPDQAVRKRAVQLLGERAWPYRFCLDVALAERLNPDAIFSFDSRWDGTIWNRAQETRWPLRERPFQKVDPYEEEDEPEGLDYEPEV